MNKFAMIVILALTLCVAAVNNTSAKENCFSIGVKSIYPRWNIAGMSLKDRTKGIEIEEEINLNSSYLVGPTIELFF